MTKFRNLKIAINDQQPLDEVVRELERLGYRKLFNPYDVGNCIVLIVIAQDNGRIDFSTSADFGDTTLAELKDLEVERHG